MTKMTTIPDNYNNIRAEIVELLRAARSTAARNVNSIMTATYWERSRNGSAMQTSRRPGFTITARPGRKIAQPSR